MSDWIVVTGEMDTDGTYPGEEGFYDETGWQKALECRVVSINRAPLILGSVYRVKRRGPLAVAVLSAERVPEKWMRWYREQYER